MLWCEQAAGEGPPTVPGFVVCDLRFVLQRESDIIQAIEQAMAGEVVDLEGCGKSMIVVHFALFEVDGDVVVVHIACAAGDFRNFLFA